MKIQKLSHLIKTKLYLVKTGEIISLDCDGILVAASRVPNTKDLKLENANILADENGYVLHNEYLQTNNPNIYVAGDAKKDFAFTYLSLDDYRIISSHMFKDKKRTTKNRGAIPFSLFVNPVFSHVGLTEKEAKEKNIDVRIAKFMPANSPKANLIKKPEGILKAIINKETGKILGASLFVHNSEELINLIKMAIDLDLDYTYFQNMIFTHPTIAENLNDLFSENNIN